MNNKLFLLPISLILLSCSPKASYKVPEVPPYVFKMNSICQDIAKAYFDTYSSKMEALGKAYFGEKYQPKIEDVQIEYMYGKYDNKFVASIVGPAVEVSSSWAMLIFANDVYVYFDNKIITLNEAYSGDVLNREQFTSLKYIFDLKYNSSKAFKVLGGGIAAFDIDNYYALYRETYIKNQEYINDKKKNLSKDSKTLLNHIEYFATKQPETDYLLAEFLNESGQYDTKITKDDYNWKYNYGPLHIKDDCYAEIINYEINKLNIHCGEEYKTTYTIDGFEFTINSNALPFVKMSDYVKNSSEKYETIYKFYTLEDAYDQKIINKEHLKLMSDLTHFSDEGTFGLTPYLDWSKEIHTNDTEID